jgi:hypothetical protein
MNPFSDAAQEPNSRPSAKSLEYDHINEVLDWLAERIGNLERESQMTDLASYPVQRLVHLAQKVNALNQGVQQVRQHDPAIAVASATDVTPPENLTQLKYLLRQLLTTVGRLEAQRFEPLPDSIAIAEFRTKTLKAPGTKRGDIANLRYMGAWGNYNPQKPQRSSWQVREANRYLEELKHKDDRRPGVWAIVVAFILAVFSLVVAWLAIPTEKSMYCKLIGCQESFDTSTTAGSASSNALRRTGQ